MRYFLLTLVVACASTPSAPPTNATPPRAEPSTTTLALGMRGHTVGTLQIRAGELGDMAVVPLDPAAADLAAAWAEVRAAGEIHVMIHQHLPTKTEIPTPQGHLVVTLPPLLTIGQSGFGPLVRFTYHPADANYLDGVKMWLGLHGVDAATEVPPRSTRKLDK